MRAVRVTCVHGVTCPFLRSDITVPILCSKMGDERAFRGMKSRGRFAIVNPESSECCDEAMFGGGVVVERWRGADGQCPVKLTVCCRSAYMCTRICLLHCSQKIAACPQSWESALELPAHAQFQHGFALSEPFYQRHRRLPRNCDKRKGFPSRMFSIVFQFSNAVVFLQRLCCSLRLDGSRQLSYDIDSEDHLSPHLDSILGYQPRCIFGVIHDLVAIPSSEIWPLPQ